MRKRHYSNNGAPCVKCGGTVYTYTVDDAESHVSASCMTCGRDNTFRPPDGYSLDTAVSVSVAHRDGWAAT